MIHQIHRAEEKELNGLGYYFCLRSLDSKRQRKCWNTLFAFLGVTDDKVFEAFVRVHAAFTRIKVGRFVVVRSKCSSGLIVEKDVIIRGKVMIFVIYVRDILMLHRWDFSFRNYKPWKDALVFSHHLVSSGAAYVGTFRTISSFFEETMSFRMFIKSTTSKRMA